MTPSHPPRPARRRRRLWLTGGTAAAVVTALTVLGLAAGQQMRREGFEGRDPLWVKGPADAAYREIAHEMTEDVYHKGQRSETIRLAAERGSFIHYVYDVGRAPVSEDLSAGLWLRGNRMGVQLLARVVLPHERNPANLEEPLTALVGGDIYQNASRWQPLQVRRPVKLLHEQQALLRAELKREINIDDAYVDRLVLNLYVGPGETEVWIDDLEVGPVLDPAPAPAAAAAPGGAGPHPGTLASRTTPRRPAVIELDRDQLRVGGKSFLFRLIRHTDTPLDVLRSAGFNAIWLDDQTPPEVVRQAADQGFWIVPAVPVVDSLDTPGDTFLTANTNLGRRVSRFLDQDPDAILFWDVGGGGLDAEHAPAVARTAQLVRSADPQRPLAADVWDGFQPYARNVNLLGVHRWPLMTSLELTQYREWLNQRRDLTRGGTFLWTWVQTHLPDWYTNMVYDHPGAAAFSEPIGPQPEQIRLLTYTALASGCRGLGFWSDRFLADSHQGRDRLLALALINQELKMLEPLLLASATPGWIDTGSGDVKAAVFRADKALLVVPIWVGRGAQFVPGQAAVPNLTITVPSVPVGTEAWEVTPGEVRPLKIERVVGGWQVTVPEFGLTSAIVFTADNTQTGLLVRLQDQSRKMRKIAAQWGHDLAEVELEKVSRVYADLEQRGHSLPEGRKRLDDTRAHLQRCADRWNDGDYGEAYRESQRAIRPLGMLMRKAWEQAAGDLDAPVASPYAVSYFTLPRHWAFADQLKGSAAGPNVLPAGDFETAPDQPAVSWAAQAITLDEVTLAARRVAEDPHSGKQCLLLQVEPKNKELPPVALERTFLAIHSPAVHLPPGTLVRITGWVRIPAAVTASADGALLYDLAGGEPLAIRLQGPVAKWRQLTWYRRVPASGTINVTVALTGMGKVYFDDLRIEPMQAGQAPAANATVVSLRSPKPKTEKKPDAPRGGLLDQR